MSKSLWTQTSQHKHWQLAKDDILKIRLHNVTHALQTHLELDQSMDVDELVQDSLEILHFYVQKIRDYATYFSLPNRVLATAIVIFKRFYFHYTMIDHNPKITVPTIILLACKVENRYLSLRRIVEATGMDEQEIRNCEYVISQGLMFDFAVYHPFLPLYGLYLELQRLNQDTDEVKSQLSKAYALAEQLILDSYFGDACFIYTPSQLAWAAMSYAYSQTFGVENAFLHNICIKIPYGNIKSELASWHAFIVDTKKVKVLSKKYSGIFKQ